MMCIMGLAAANLEMESLREKEKFKKFKSLKFNNCERKTIMTIMIKIQSIGNHCARRR